jgi:NYN domain
MPSHEPSPTKHPALSQDLFQLACRASGRGIDVRIALDVIRLAHRREYDVAVLFCRDQDLSELADEVRTISQEQNRWIKTASAYPYSAAVKNFRGIDRTDWIRIDRATYDACLDTRDYRPKPKP